MAQRTGTRAIAVFEFAKGLLVLTVGLGLLGLIHRDTQGAAEDLVRLFHLNPASHYPRIFLDASAQLHDAGLWALAAGAAAYAAIRIVEGIGLWHDRRWASWFGLVSCLLYVPWEIYEVIERASRPRLLLLALNTVIAIVLARHLRHPDPRR